MTKAAIQELDWEILPRASYSPDLAPSDYIRCLSNYLRGVSFNNDAELQNWMDEIFRAIPTEFFKLGIENLPESWETVVNNGGQYIID
jgi:hypothetical protein